LFDLTKEPQSYEEIIARARHVRTKLGIIATPKPVTVQNCRPPAKPKRNAGLPSNAAPADPAAPLSDAAKEALRSPLMQAFLDRHHYGAKDKSESLTRFVAHIERWVAIQQQTRPTWVVQTIRLFCIEHEIPAVVLFSDCKIARAMEMRHKLWAILHENHRKPSYAQIARWFRRDHTSIIYGVQRHLYGKQGPMVQRKHGPKALPVDRQAVKNAKQFARREALKASIQAWDASKWAENP
jgi:hypothetical protein